MMAKPLFESLDVATVVNPDITAVISDIALAIPDTSPDRVPSSKILKTWPSISIMLDTTLESSIRL